MKSILYFYYFILLLFFFKKIFFVKTENNIISMYLRRCENIVFPSLAKINKAFYYKSR